jgi:hypothetical protein
MRKILYNINLKKEKLMLILEQEIMPNRSTKSRLKAKVRLKSEEDRVDRL